MKQKRRRYSGALKAKVGLEAVMGIKTTSQIAREHQVHPLLVTQWKRILLDRLPGIFERGPQAPDESEKTILHRWPENRLAYELNEACATDRKHHQLQDCISRRLCGDLIECKNIAEHQECECERDQHNLSDGTYRVA